jgi:hypothetical protein
MGQAESVLDCEHAHSGHRLRTIEKCQAFFRSELERSKSSQREHFHAGHSLASVKGFALANDDQRQMGKWRKIAAGSN